MPGRGHIKTPLTSLVDETFLQEHNLSNLTNENCLGIKIRSETERSLWIMFTLSESGSKAFLCKTGCRLLQVTCVMTQKWSNFLIVHVHTEHPSVRCWRISEPRRLRLWAWTWKAIAVDNLIKLLCARELLSPFLHGRQHSYEEDSETTKLTFDFFLPLLAFIKAEIVEQKNFFVVCWVKVVYAVEGLGDGDEAGPERKNNIQRGWNGWPENVNVCWRHKTLIPNKNKTPANDPSSPVRPSTGDSTNF